MYPALIFFFLKVGDRYPCTNRLYMVLKKNYTTISSLYVSSIWEIFSTGENSQTKKKWKRIENEYMIIFVDVNIKNKAATD